MKPFFVRYILLLLSVATGINISAQTNTNQNSLLWEITGNGLKKPSYLYGTIHIPDKRVFAFNDSVLPKLKQSAAFATEIAFNTANQARMAKASLLPAGKKLKDFFSEKEYQRLKEHLAKNGYDIEQMQQFKPFVVISLISQGQVKNDMPYVVDEYLSNSAKENGKEILGIEEVEEQMALIDKLPITEMLQALDDTDNAAAEKEMETMVNAYAAADLDKLQELILQFETEEKLMGKQLLTDRNYIMADRISGMIKKQTVFAAVGAGHLPGKEGVIALLRKKGYKVQPIIAKHTPVKDDFVKENSGSVVIESLTPFVVDNNDFTVTFPSMPDTSVQALKTDVGEMQLNLYNLETETDNVVYMASYTHYPKDKAPKDEKALQLFLDGVANGTTSKMMGATIKSKTPITLNGHAGIEVIIDYMGSKATIYMKNYMVANRLYTIQVINTANDDHNQAMKAFFESFRIK